MVKSPEFQILKDCIVFLPRLMFTISQMSKNMTKKLANEKEIEKNRSTSKWKNVIQLVSALNVKNAGGALNSGRIIS